MKYKIFALNIVNSKRKELATAYNETMATLIVSRLEYSEEMSFWRVYKEEVA